MLRKLFCVFIFCFFINTTQALSTSADSAILMEMESGRILYEENIDEEKLIASITKLMTALIALESEIPLQEMVEITQESSGVEGSSLYLKEGDEITLEALLYGLLLHSGNDAAVAIAIACGGSQEEFVQLMNEKALALGMEHSNFENPHGLDGENHYSSARDMALLAQACLGNETLAEMVATQSIRLSQRYFTNKNKLLWNYEGCVGMKTGYTQLAGRTLVSAASRDGMTLICVTLNDRDDWLDHSNLFDYGFGNYTMTTWSAEATLPVTESLKPLVSLKTQEEFRYPLAEGEEISVEMIGGAVVEAPVLAGVCSDSEVVYSLAEEELARLPLYYQEDCGNLTEESFWTQSKAFWKNLFSS